MFINLSIDSLDDLVAECDDLFNRSGIEFLRNWYPNRHVAITLDNSEPSSAVMRLDMDPIRTVLLSIIHDKDDWENTRQPRTQVCFRYADRNELALLNVTEMVSRLDLDGDPVNFPFRRCDRT